RLLVRRGAPPDRGGGRGPAGAGCGGLVGGGGSVGHVVRGGRTGSA
ncbi:MAG: KfrA protein, partial [Gemmatimonadetes bacterium]|nr:KfrA protein [Gemmatimonadota bacterium]